MADNQEVMDAAPEQIAPVAPEMSETTMAGFTAEDLAKARAQEKAKLYPQMEKMAEELATLKKEREEEAARKQAKLAEREAQKAEKAKQKEEQELSFKELLAKKEQEFNSQLENERLERERAIALLDQERKFQDLMAYRSQRLDEERDSIVPQLIDLIGGNTPDEIEQSIATLKDKSAGIMQDVMQTVQASKQQMVGTRITAPASGPLDNEMGQQSYTPEGIRGMDMAEYQKQRAKLLGTAANNRGQGLFG
jgi:hypothetical protein